MTKFKIWGATALALTAGLWVVPAAAQDGATAIDEIVVVAQKREENLQDVPLAVSAIPGQEITQLLSGGGDILQLAGRTPGLNVETSNGHVAPRFYIRGLGNSDFDLAASQPVSVIMDDVVMENVVLKGFPLFDIGQVEVLRGPQGTLYGRNTPAGIVHIRSNRPSDAFEAIGNLSWGSYNTASFDGAISGPIANGISARASLLVSHRDDWVDNAFDGTELGGNDEVAGRLQLLFEPTENFSALLNLHGRSFDGTSTLFRGNVFDTGSNELNGNFDRDRVSYNGGGGNHQKYDGYGAGLTMDYAFGNGLTLTSITGYETTNGDSRGDIDGNPVGFFDTQDSIDDLDQFTQEIRLASPDTGPFTWQVGAYYFDGEFQVTTDIFVPPVGTVVHENTSWAVFGQASYDITERLTLTGGVRYTDDQKELTILSSSLPQPTNFIEVSGEQTTWDLSLGYELTPDVNLYARVATGFRAPSIQARDVGVFGFPSTAAAETITSYEAGVKADVLNGTGRINAAIYSYTIEDQQFTAIGGAANSTQLVNADEGKGYGFEVEAAFDVTENFSVTAGIAYTHTEINDANLTVEACGSLQCTPLDPVAVPGAPSTVFVNGNPFPNAPEFTADLGARYVHPWGDGGQFFAETDWVFRGETNFFLYEATEFKTDVQFEGGLRLGYARTDGAYEVALFARNITDEENVIGAIDFNNNLGFVNEPRIIGVSLSMRH